MRKNPIIKGSTDSQAASTQRRPAKAQAGALKVRHLDSHQRLAKRGLQRRSVKSGVVDPCDRERRAVKPGEAALLAQQGAVKVEPGNQEDEHVEQERGEPPPESRVERPGRIHAFLHEKRSVRDATRVR
jgi:hypothetical protein